MAWTPDPATASVFSTLVINSIIGTIFLILFELFRNKNAEVFAPRLRTAKETTIARPNNGVLGWLKQIWEVSDNDLLHMIGLDGYVFLRYLKMCARIGGSCCLFLVILLPTYYTAAGSEGVVGIGLFSMANVPEKGDRLWMCWIISYIFTFIFLYFMYYEYEHFAAVRKQFFKEGDREIPPQIKYSVQVENIPSEYKSTKKLRAFFNSLFPGEVLHCNVAVFLSPLDALVAERKTLVSKLESAVAKLEAHPDKIRPMMKLKKGKVAMCGGDEEVDAIRFYNTEIEAVNARITAFQAKCIDAEAGKFKNDDDEDDGASQHQGAGSNSLSVGLLNNSHLNDHNADHTGEVEPYSANSPINDEKRERLRAESNEHKKTQKLNATIPTTNDDDKSLILKDDKDSVTHEKDQKNYSKIKTTKTGFVTFKSRRAQVVACQSQVLSERYPLVTAIPAPTPSDIIWDNIGARPGYTKAVSLQTAMMYRVGLIFWALIMAFIAAVSNISTLETFLPFLADLDTISYSLLQGLLPVVILIVFLAMVPVFMAFVAKTVEKRKTVSGVQIQVFNWFFMYQLANVYLILLAGSVFDSLNDAINDPASIITLIGAALPQVSTFFINFILTSLLVGVPGVYLRLVPLIIFKLYRLIFKESAMTRRAYVEGPLASVSVDYGTTLPGFLYIFCLMMLYWVIAPILLIVATLFFGASYLAWKYQYLYVIKRSFESGGLFFYGLYNYSMVGLIFGNVTMIAFMGIKQGAAQTPLLIPLLLIVLYMWRYTENQFKSLSLNMPYSAAVDSDIGHHAEEKKATKGTTTASVVAAGQASDLDTVERAVAAAGDAKAEEETEIVGEDSSDVIATFTEDFNKQPNLTNREKAYPYPYRINGTPLFSATNELNEVYHADVPAGINLEEELEKYLVDGVVAVQGSAQVGSDEKV